MPVPPPLVVSASDLKAEPGPWQALPTLLWDKAEERWLCHQAGSVGQGKGEAKYQLGVQVQIEQCQRELATGTKLLPKELL